MTAGVGLAAMCLVLGITEFATVGSIRPPTAKTFSSIFGTTLHYRTVFLPAVGALISGLFVSLSASFFYAGITGQVDPWEEWIGPGLFVVAAVALAVTLRSALKNAAEPAALARDPYTIRAAAQEYAASPRRALLEPNLLRTQLEEWERSIASRSLGVTGNLRCPSLERYLDDAAVASGVKASVIPSLKVYIAACRRFPIRLGWSMGGGVAFVVGAVWVVIAELDPGWTTSWRTWAGLALVAVLCSLVMTAVILFYGWARGNRARLWHRLYREALLEAWHAIAHADIAFADIRRDSMRTRRILDGAEVFLASLEPRRDSEFRVLLQLGRFRVVLGERKRSASS